MQLLKSLVFGLSAFAAHAVAQEQGSSGSLAFTSIPSSVTAGQPVPITYTGGDGPATIILREGDPSNLSTITTLTTSATGGTYIWTPDSSLPSGSRYALEIRQGETVNYSGQFALASSGPASSVISSAASVISSASSAISSVQSSVSSESVSSVSSVVSSISSSVSSELSSALSSAVSSIIVSVESSITSDIIIGTVGTTGATIPMTRNATMVSPTLSSSSTDSTSTSTATSTRTTGTTRSATGTSATGTSTGAPNTNAAAGLSSPLALVLGAVAAMIYLN